MLIAAYLALDSRYFCQASSETFLTYFLKVLLASYTTLPVTFDHKCIEKRADFVILTAFNNGKHLSSQSLNIDDFGKVRAC
jgi:hypothetical protein